VKYSPFNTFLFDAKWEWCSHVLCFISAFIHCIQGHVVQSINSITMYWHHLTGFSGINCYQAVLYLLQTGMKLWVLFESPLYVGNECEETWTSLYCKRSTKSTSQSHDSSWNLTHLTLASCRITLVELCICSMDKKSAIKFQCSECKVGLNMCPYFCVSHAEVKF
jgi:hypothetical protein